MPKSIDFTSLDDGDLMLYIQRGYEQAFTELVHRFRSKMLGTAMRILHREDLAEDAVQTAFLNIYRHRTNFRHNASVATWIFQIVKNEALMLLRRNRIRLLSGTQDDVSHAVESIESREPDPATLYEQEVLRRIILRAVGRLRPELREVFLLRDVYGLTPMEIAKQLGISVQATKSRLHRARATLAGYISRSVAPRTKRGGSP